MNSPLAPKSMFMHYFLKGVPYRIDDELRQKESFVLKWYNDHQIT